MRRNTLKEERLELAQVLGRLIAKQMPFIYIDETTFHTQMPPMRKSWSLRSKHNLHSINNKKYKSVTVYGAIGNCLHEPLFYYTQKATNQVHYREFLLKLKDKIRGL